MLIHSSTHTVGSTIRWRIQYSRWLENTAFIEDTSTVESSDATYTVSGVTVVGRDLVFLVSGGALNLPVTLTITMRDSLGNVLIDTVNLVGTDP